MSSVKTSVDMWYFYNVSEGGVNSTGAEPVGGDASADGNDDLVFKALANPARRRMLDVLKQTSVTTGELCARLPELDRTTALQHLRVLEGANLVAGHRVGRERYLTLSPMPIKRIYDRWISSYARAAMELLERLEAE